MLTNSLKKKKKKRIKETSFGFKKFFQNQVSKIFPYSIKFDKKKSITALPSHTPPPPHLSHNFPFLSYPILVRNIKPSMSPHPAHPIILSPDTYHRYHFTPRPVRIVACAHTYQDQICAPRIAPKPFSKSFPKSRPEQIRPHLHCKTNIRYPPTHQHQAHQTPPIPRKKGSEVPHRGWMKNPRASPLTIAVFGGGGGIGGRGRARYCGDSRGGELVVAPIYIYNVLYIFSKNFFFSFFFSHTTSVC